MQTKCCRTTDTRWELRSKHLISKRSSGSNERSMRCTELRAEPPEAADSAVAAEEAEVAEEITDLVTITEVEDLLETEENDDIK